MFIGENSGLVVETRTCQKCFGHGCDDAKDAEPVKSAIDCAPVSCRTRGRAGNLQGNAFSGVIGEERGQADRSPQCAEDGLLLQ